MDTCPVIRLSCGFVPLLAALPFVPFFVSYRLASLPAPFLVSSSGAMSCCGRERIAFLVRAMWYQAGGVSGCLPHDVGDIDVMHRYRGRGSIALDMASMCVGRWRRDAASLRACSPHPVSLAPLASPVVISYRHRCPLPRRLALLPVSRVDRRGAISCLPCLSLSSPSISAAAFMRARCHARRAEMMGMR